MHDEPAKHEPRPRGLLAFDTSVNSVLSWMTNSPGTHATREAARLVQSGTEFVYSPVVVVLERETLGPAAEARCKVATEASLP